MLKNCGHLKLSKHNFEDIKLSTKSTIDLNHHTYLCSRLLQKGLDLCKNSFSRGRCSPSSLFKPFCSSSRKEAAVALFLPLASRCSSAHNNVLESPTWKSGSSKKQNKSSGHAKTEVLDASLMGHISNHNYK